MRKLKLQVQMSVDGFIGGPNGEMDWMVWNWDDKLTDYVAKLTDTVDTILLGRKMTDGFVGYWSSVTPDNQKEYPFAKKMVDFPKIVFSRTLTESKWPNTTLAKAPLSEEVRKLKSQKGKDIIAYGGAGFDSSLIQEGLIDEFHLFVNPALLGNGLSIFKEIKERQNLKLVKAIPFDCGIVLLHYERI